MHSSRAVGYRPERGATLWLPSRRCQEHCAGPDDSRLLLQTAPWTILLPAGALALTILGPNLLGDSATRCIPGSPRGDSGEDSTMPAAEVLALPFSSTIPRACRLLGRTVQPP